MTDYSAGGPRSNRERMLAGDLYIADDPESGRLPITLEDYVWLGGGVIVCPGVTIGGNSVIGAGAVVTKDMPANVITVGNPARVAREIGEQDAVINR